MFVFFIFLFLFISHLVVCDDTQALRDVVKCLCEENTDGEFGSCCSAHSNGTSITISDLRCFISELVLDSSEQVTGLFVFHYLSVFIHFYLIQSKLMAKD